MFNLDQVTKMNQDVINAMTASSTVAQKGLQQIASETSEFTKKSYEDSAAVAEKLVADTAKDADDFGKLFADESGGFADALLTQ